jgi:hypothetical protein
VDLRGRLSRHETQSKIDDLNELIKQVEHSPELPTSPLPGIRRRWWQMRDRLDEESRRQLAEDRQAGATLKMLAQTYGGSLSSVQRLLRQFEGNT